MTFLNPEHFYVIAGQGVVDRIRASRFKLPISGPVGDLLVDMQKAEARAGIRGAEVMSTSYGYSVRADSGLQGFALLASARKGELDGSLASAKAWAKHWVSNDPGNRYAFMRLPLEGLPQVKQAFQRERDIRAAQVVPGSLCNIPMLDGKPEEEEREYAEPVVAEVWGGSAGRYVTQVTYMSGNRYFVGPHGSDYAIFGPGDFFREAETIEGAVKWLTDPDRWSW